ncbi:MAG TPA: hypothetical protein VL551_12625 [Actinospica sp.]|nr:hypothetical protein [Actinospica sp.]
MVKLTASARCQVCAWVPEGDPDRSAEKHTKATGHATAVEARPA